MYRQELPRSVYDELDRRGLNGVPVLLSTTHRPVALRPAAPALDRRHARQRRRRRRRRRADRRSARAGARRRRVSHAGRDRLRLPAGVRRRPLGRPGPLLERRGRAVPPRRPVPRRRCARPASSKSTTRRRRRRSRTARSAASGCPTAGEACPRCIPRKAILGRLGQMLWPYRWTAAVMCGLMLVAVAAELAPPKLQQYLVDHILKGGEAAPDAPGLLAALFAVVLALAAARARAQHRQLRQGPAGHPRRRRAHVRPAGQARRKAPRARPRLLRQAPGRLAHQPRRLRQRSDPKPAAANHRRLPAADRAGHRRRRHAVHAQPEARRSTRSSPRRW